MIKRLEIGFPVSTALFSRQVTAGEEPFDERFFSGFTSINR
jgi:hypothetical protein